MYDADTARRCCTAPNGLRNRYEDHRRRVFSVADQPRRHTQLRADREYGHTPAEHPVTKTVRVRDYTGVAGILERIYAWKAATPRVRSPHCVGPGWRLCELPRRRRATASAWLLRSRGSSRDEQPPLSASSDAWLRLPSCRQLTWPPVPVEAGPSPRGGRMRRAHGSVVRLISLPDQGPARFLQSV